MNDQQHSRADALTDWTDDDSGSMLRAIEALERIESGMTQTSADHLFAKTKPRKMTITDAKELASVHLPGLRRLFRKLEGYSSASPFSSPVEQHEAAPVRGLRGCAECTDEPECAWHQECQRAKVAPAEAENFACYLIDKCERETVTEENVQAWLGAMLRDPQYATTQPTPSAPLEGTGNGADERAAFDMSDAEWCDVFERIKKTVPNVFGSYAKVRAEFAREAIRIAAAARASSPNAAGADSDTERALSETIDERDQMEEIGTRLANAVGEFLGVDVGEWSSANDPILAAIEALESRAPRTDWESTAVANELWQLANQCGYTQFRNALIRQIKQAYQDGWEDCKKGVASVTYGEKE
ncbi:hypothetical protein KDX40_13235 [Burkholderia ambifaria]|uniref:hypothetical protein n=1 Tax=Burkholderia ambifaria TaxID=152480 RepID=UPI001B98EFF3|nr:hypothetical protein [Burkholderia ambifaria]MBR8344702.1 hypothetical protein [Burkholderia ambifaria]